MQLQLYGKKIWVYHQAVDFRCGIDGLSQVVINALHQSPCDDIYLFFNRHRDKVKVLSWHKNGFVLLCKRLEQGRFPFHFGETPGAISIDAQSLSWLLAGLDWQVMRTWGELDYQQFS